MNRPTFLLITAIVSALFGIATLFMPSKTAKGYGVAATAEIKWLFRILGGMILSAGVLNFLLRNEKNSVALQALFIFNIIFYVIRICNDAFALRQKLFPLAKIYIGEIVHLFISIGSLIFLLKMNIES